MERAGADASDDGSFAWHTNSAAKSRASQSLASTPILTATPTHESLQHTLTNHAMTFIHSATTRRASRSGPARTPPCWTQPPCFEQLGDLLRFCVGEHIPPLRCGPVGDGSRILRSGLHAHGSIGLETLSSAHLSGKVGGALGGGPFVGDPQRIALKG